MHSDFELCSQRFTLVKPPQRDNYTEFTHLGQAPNGEVTVALRERVAKIPFADLGVISIYRPLVCPNVPFKDGVPDWQNASFIPFGHQIDAAIADPQWRYEIVSMNDYGDCLVRTDALDLRNLRHGAEYVLDSEFGMSWIREGATNFIGEGLEGVTVLNSRQVLAIDRNRKETPRILLETDLKTFSSCTGRCGYWGADELADFVSASRQGHVILSPIKTYADGVDFGTREFGAYLPDKNRAQRLVACSAVSHVSDQGVVLGLSESVTHSGPLAFSRYSGAYWHPQGACGEFLGDMEEDAAYCLPLSSAHLPRLSDHEPDMHVFVGKKTVEDIVVVDEKYPDQIRGTLDRDQDKGAAQLWFARHHELTGGYPLVGTDLNTCLSSNGYVVESAFKVTQDLLMLARARNSRGVVREVLLVPEQYRDFGR